MHFIFVAFVLVGIAYGYLLFSMPDNIAKQVENDNEGEIYVDIGGKKVPWNSVNKPHAVVLGSDQKPVPDPATFPDIEPAAKEREARLEAERKQ